MANNRLYIADPKTKKAIMIAKSLGKGWYPWYQKDKSELHKRLSSIFCNIEELGSLGGNTGLKLITEYSPDFEDYQIIDIYKD